MDVKGLWVYTILDGLKEDCWSYEEGINASAVAQGFLSFNAQWCKHQLLFLGNDFEIMLWLFVLQFGSYPICAII